MNWENTLPEDRQDSRYTSQLRSAIVVSLVLHGLILGVVLWMMEQRAQNQLASIPETVRINLLSFAETVEQQSSPIEPEPRDETGQADVVPDLPDGIAEASSTEPVEIPLEQVPLQEPAVELPRPAYPPTIADDNEEVVDSPRVPDSVALRHTVRAVRELQSRNGNLTTCTPAQRRSELIDCPDAAEPDYTVALRDPEYLLFSQPRDNDQSRRAMGTISGNQQQLRSGIQAFSLDEVDNQYLLEELSQGLEVYSGTGNTRLERLTEQIYRNDPAYQQAKRIMTPR